MVSVKDVNLGEAVEATLNDPELKAFLQENKAGVIILDDKVAKKGKLMLYEDGFYRVKSSKHGEESRELLDPEEVWLSRLEGEDFLDLLQFGLMAGYRKKITDFENLSKLYE